MGVAGALSSGRLLPVLGLVVLAGCATGPTGADRPTSTPESGSASLGVSASPEAGIRLTVAADADRGAKVRSRDVEVVGGGGALVEVVSEAAGAVRVAAGPGGPVLRFPDLADSSSGSAAVLRVETFDGRSLSPGAADFRFGAEVALDAESSGGTADNGDNVVQRGLVDADAQFKLQVDRRRPSCTFKGSARRAEIWSPQDLEPGRWYRLVCERRGDEISVAVSELGPEGPGTTRRTTKEASVGALDFDLGTPLTVGGKVTPGGGLSRSPDQLNGLLASAFVEIR